MEIFDHSKFGITKACNHSNFLFICHMDDELFRLRNHSNFNSSYVIGPNNALIPSKQIPKRFTMRLAKPYQKDFRVVMVILSFFKPKITSYLSKWRQNFLGVTLIQSLLGFFVHVGATCPNTAYNSPFVAVHCGTQ